MVLAKPRLIAENPRRQPCLADSRARGTTTFQRLPPAAMMRSVEWFNPEEGSMMPRQFDPIPRRFMLRALGLGALTGRWPSPSGAAAAVMAKRPRVAAVFTDFRFRLHAFDILENFLNPYLFNGEATDPGCDIVSFYADQFHQGDMARDIARQFSIPIYPSIAGALRLGGDALAVDAVLAIGEHGEYPRNERGVVEYPRKRFFDEIVAVFEKSGRSVPVFNDKHLSYRWDWAREMVDTSRRLGFPLMAGSSVPLAQRRPPLELPAHAKLTSAVSIHGGPVESYDFHGLEVLQSLVEARAGGEVGVSKVQFLDEPALWKAADAGLWSTKLADAALAAELGPELPTVRSLVESRKLGDAPSHGILIDYADGFRAIVLKVGVSSTRWDFAASIAGRDAPAATSFYVGPWRNRNLFKALSHAIQHLFTTGETPYPIERTLLTTGVLAAAMDSRARDGEAQATPHLKIAYQPRDFRAMREMGASWKVLTEETPEPKGLGRILK